jgi:hypothetical protein
MVVCGCFSSGSQSHAEEEEDRREKKRAVAVGLSHVLCHAPFLAKFLVCLATKIVHSSLR